MSTELYTYVPLKDLMKFVGDIKQVLEFYGSDEGSGTVKVAVVIPEFEVTFSME